MQLSIEAIIILVIAFVLLGLGIVFVKNFFAKAGSQTDRYIDQAGSACNTATLDNPITPTKFQIKQGGSSTQEICVLNNAAKPIKTGKLELIKCYEPTAGAEATAGTISIISGPLPIQRAEGKSYQATIKTKGDASLGTYICNIQVKDTEGTEPAIVGPIQITVEVI